MYQGEQIRRAYFTDGKSIRRIAAEVGGVAGLGSGLAVAVGVDTGGPGSREGVDRVKAPSTG